MDERDDYSYGWSAAGERFYGLKSGRRQGRINMIAGYRNAQLIAPFTRGKSSEPVMSRHLTSESLTPKGLQK